MTIDELRQTLLEARSTGKIGTPVALRVHVQLQDRQANFSIAVAAVMQLAKSVLEATPIELTARSDIDRRQLNVLFRYAGGQTVLVTLGRGAVSAASLQLLLVGNHGVVRLAGGDGFDERSLTAGDDVDRWNSWIDNSLSRGATVSLDVPGEDDSVRI